MTYKIYHISQLVLPKMLSCYNFGEVSWPGKEEENLSGENDVVEVSQLLP